MLPQTNPPEQLPVERPRPTRTMSWWRVLLAGVFFYVVGVVVLIMTGNPILFPTVVLIGSFMVPVTYVTFFYNHRHLSRLTMPTVALSFFYGGLLGVFAAAILEPLFIHRLDPASFLIVGLIEEFAKILGVLVIARRAATHDSELDGLILGAAAGMGFAALESTGYAFTAFLQSGGSLSATVSVELLRGLLSPIGHGTWTAILAGVLFRESRPGHFHFNLKVLAAYLGVVILHALWDGAASGHERAGVPRSGYIHRTGCRGRHRPVCPVAALARGETAARGQPAAGDRRVGPAKMHSNAGMFRHT